MIKPLPYNTIKSKSGIRNLNKQGGIRVIRYQAGITNFNMLCGINSILSNKYKKKLTTK
jgi:hypothetical protein